MKNLKQAITAIEDAQFLPPVNGDQWYKLIADIKTILREAEDEFAIERQALELACTHIFNAEIPQAFWDKKADYFRSKAKE